MTNDVLVAVEERDKLAQQQQELRALRDRLLSELSTDPPIPHVQSFSIDKLLKGEPLSALDHQWREKQQRVRACDQALRQLPEQLAQACERVIRLQERAVCEATWHGPQFAQARRAWNAAIAAIEAAERAERDAATKLDTAVVGYVPPDPLSGRWAWLEGFRAWRASHPEAI